jgi:hypothetical protein
MRTKAGDRLLVDNVHWKYKKKCYEVTLYIDGKPKVYEVDKVYKHGVGNPGDGFLWTTSSEKNIATIYEAAIAKAIGFGDLDDGGTPGLAMEMITGQKAARYDTNYILPEYRQWFSDRLAEGDAVVASSVRDNALKFEDVRIERPDGKVVTEDIKIVKEHSYSVERIDKDGNIWVRNPQGPGNSADGGGLIRLTPRQYEEAFPWTTVQD